MKKSLLLLIALILSAAPLPVAYAQTPIAADPIELKNIRIVALQTARTDAAGEDFVVLYNPNEVDVDVTGWSLQYRSASATGDTGWKTKHTIACDKALSSTCKVLILPRSHLILSSYEINGVESIQKITSGFSSEGGQIRFVQPGAGKLVTVHDRLGYGSAVDFEGEGAAPAPAVNASIVRSLDTDGQYIDTDDNKTDFVAGCYDPVEASTLLGICAPVEEPETPEPTPDETEVPEPAPTYVPLVITELLPDPQSPQTDAADEFIELYNPTNQQVELKDYQLQAGTEFRSHFVITEGVIPPLGYTAIPSALSGLALSNSGTAVRLLDPADVVVSEVANYGPAEPGEAWAKNNDGIWSWTTQPTPGAVNAIVLKPPKAPAVKKATTATKKATTPKVAKASTPKKTAEATDEPYQEPPETKPNYSLLLPIGASTLGYVGYEYRQDAAKTGRRIWRFITGKHSNSEE